METSTENDKHKTPINYFAKFFLGYTIGLSLVVATMPVLVSKFNVLPMFSSMKNSMSFVASLTSYLWVGYLWANRHFFAKKMFPYKRVKKGVVYSKRRFAGIGTWSSILPAILVGLTVLFFFGYTESIRSSVKKAIINYSSKVNSADSVSYNYDGEKIENRMLNKFGVDFRVGVIKKVEDLKKKIYKYEVIIEDEKVSKIVLSNLPLLLIKNKFLIYFSFLGIFLLSSTTFILFGLKDYIQQRRGITDDDIEQAVELSIAIFQISGYANIHGSFEYVVGDDSYKYDKIKVVKSTDNESEVWPKKKENGTGLEFYYRRVIVKDKEPVEVEYPFDAGNESDDTMEEFQKKLHSGAERRFSELHNLN